MGKTPEIIQVLRKEEKLGKFKSSEDSTDFSYSPTINEKDLLFNAANDMFLYLDKKGIVLDINKSGLDISGFEKSEVINKAFWKLTGIFSVKNLPKFMKVYKDALQGKITTDFICDLKNKYGKKYIMNFSTYPIFENSKLKKILVISKDISDEEKAKEKKVLSEKKFENIFNLSPSGIMIVDKKGNVQRWNKACEEIFGWKAEEVIGNFNPTVPEEMKDFYFKSMRKDSKNLEIKALSKNKEFVDISLSTQPLFDDNNNFIGSLGVMTDISERKQVEKALKESEKLFRTLVEQSTVGVYIHDPVNNKILYANPLVRSVLGFSKDEIDKVDFFKYLHPDDVKLIKNRTQKILSGEKVDPNVDVRIFPPDSKMRWIRLYSTFIEYKGKKAALASIIDITDSKKGDDKEKEYLNKLEKYKDTTVGRELRVVELKKEINELCREQGLPIKYKDTEKALKNDRLEMEVDS